MPKKNGTFLFLPYHHLLSDLSVEGNDVYAFR
ncbi:hypothetical protein TFUB4_00624 [Tannerella forsythia]|uniref:Uncharacterized protein n=1 Tax=Tannerella forsythia TaxID=28112 RepID=A0A1D3UGY8_TANFO|nr:hypothetical protein TFUB4_00624 [Tannerella forsythia]SCQ19303.1 hypothetical protein TFUB20_00662 [Tannerella forsythia]SCQ19412.1 hypothetical protein TFUB22_00613 [Tannerella forsythia]